MPNPSASARPPSFSCYLYEAGSRAANILLAVDGRKETRETKDRGPKGEAIVILVAKGTTGHMRIQPTRSNGRNYMHIRACSLITRPSSARKLYAHLYARAVEFGTLVQKDNERRVIHIMYIQRVATRVAIFLLLSISIFNLPLSYFN